MRSILIVMCAALAFSLPIKASAEDAPLYMTPQEVDASHQRILCETPDQLRQAKEGIGHGRSASEILLEINKGDMTSPCMLATRVAGVSEGEGTRSIFTVGNEECVVERWKISGVEIKTIPDMVRMELWTNTELYVIVFKKKVTDT